MTKDKLKEEIIRAGLADIVDPLGITIKTKVDNALDRFITQDTELLALKRKVRKLSKSKINILIIGESGVGKELLAEALHGTRTGKFVAVNCGGIPESLLESEFFGHKKGSFTGAFYDREGYFEEAANGTLFLDEIGEMPRLLQCKLLRVLQSMTVRKIGDNKETKVNCRIVSATNKTREWLENDNNFRSDLYYRLAATTINVKPLNERREDAILILRHAGLNPDDFKGYIENNSWKGNIRQLLNLIEEHKALNQD